MAAADVTLTRADSPSRGREAARRPRSSQGWLPGICSAFPSPWISISSLSQPPHGALAAAAAGEAAGLHIRAGGAAAAGPGEVVPSWRGAGLCCACVVLGAPVALQGVGPCRRQGNVFGLLWGPFPAVGLVIYLPCYRRGWVRAHHELCSPFPAVEEALIPHTATNNSLWDTPGWCVGAAEPGGDRASPGAAPGSALQGATAGNEEKLSGLRIPGLLCLCAVQGFQQVCHCSLSRMLFPC